MRNLLWKFVALVGVTGIGFMVVVQVMEGLSGVPDLSSQQAAASDAPGNREEQFLEPPAALHLPPLETTETVGMANSFPSLAEPEPQPVDAAAPLDGSQEPVSAGNPPFPTPASEEPTPAEIPLEFPTATESPAPTPAEPPAPELRSADLPILVPRSEEAAVPNLEVFAEEPSAPESPGFSEAPGPTPATAPGPIQQPSLAENNPFSDPVPTPKGEEPQAPETSFDPYEPLPESTPSQTPTPANPLAPEPPIDPTWPTLEPTAATEDQPVIAPVSEAPMAADPLDNLPPLAAPEINPEPAPQVAEFEPTNAEPSPTEPTNAEPSKPEIAADPFAPQEPPTPVPPTPASPPKQPPGRATVRTSPPLAKQPPEPTAPAFPEPQPPEPTAPAFPEPQPPVASPQRDIPLAPRPTPATAGSLAPTPPVEKPSRDMKPLPDITMPLVGGPQMSPPAKGPECAVPQCAIPVVAVGEPSPANPSPEPAAAPFVDPLDQLTFPEPAPSTAEIPEQNKPAHHLIPASNNSPLTPERPAEPSQPPGPLPDITPWPLNPPGEAPPASVHQPESQPAAPPEESNAGEPLEGLPTSGPQQPKLKIEKTAPPKAVLNQPMIYHILVRNVGASAAHEVVVEDQVPQGTKLTGTIPRGEMANNRLIWRLGALNPGEEKKIAVRVIPTQEGQVGSVAKVSFVAEVASQTVVASPKLKLEMSGPGNAVVGDALTYHFQIENHGSGDAGKVFLRNVLPDGLSHPSGDDLEYEVGLLKAGQKKEIDLTVNAAKAGEFSNTAMLIGAGGLKTEASAQVKILGDRLTITRTGPKRRYVGRRASFSNTLVNQSERKVESVRVVESVPAGMEFVKASAGGQYDPNNRTVTWAIAELGPKAHQLLQLELLAKTEGPQTSQVTAFDPNGSRAVVKSETTVDGYTALRLDVAEYDDPVDVGEQVGLRVVATNRGTRATTNAVVKLTIPAEMEFVSGKGPVDFKRDGQTLTFHPIPSLEARGEMAFDLVLKSVKAGDARLRLEIGSDQMAKPLLREEGIRILAKRP